MVDPTVALFLVLSIVVGPFAFATASHAQSQQPNRPKLILLLVADQFSANYMARFQDRMSMGGLRFLMEHGINFTNCRYNFANTHTGPGQAAIATGGNPWATGIIGDEVFDRRKGRAISIVSDDNAQVIGGSGPGTSPKFLTGTTIGDQMRLASNGGSRVITIATNPVASVLMGGRLANYAFWWDTKTGNFVTSSQYSHDLPAWAKTFNDQRYADRYFGKPWQRLMPETQYTASTRDDYPYERGMPGGGRTFPHTITGGAGGPSEPFFNAFAMTPWANQMVCDFAQQAIEKENLGARRDPDFLSLNFSSTEGLGTAFGPNSHEMQDMVLRLDQSIASLLTYVDQRLGLNNCLIIFTAAHGVSPIPEFLRERGVDSGRISPKALREALESALDQRLGPADWVEACEPPYMYLNLDAIEEKKQRQPQVEMLSANSARISGVFDVYTAVQFLLNELPLSPVIEEVRRSYRWKRSGELYVVAKPGWIFSNDNAGTDSGSSYSYDCQVPLFVFGSGVNGGGRNAHAVSPTDIAPTISALLNIEEPSVCEGKALKDAIGQYYGPPRPRSTEMPPPPQ